jgi:hypothetical protein
MLGIAVFFAQRFELLHLLCRGHHRQRRWLLLDASGHRLKFAANLKNTLHKAAKQLQHGLPAKCCLRVGGLGYTAQFALQVRPAAQPVGRAAVRDLRRFVQCL